MKYYFAADVHLGLQAGDARAREDRFVRWLDEVKNDATELFLLGDIFDFWCEYKTAVPRGFVRTLGKLAEIADSGIPVHFFIGNHDLWVTDYLQKEVGLIVHRTPLETKLGPQTFFMAHGDYLDASRNFLRRLFGNRTIQVCFRAVHPRWGLALGQRWSSHNRATKGVATPFTGENEFIIKFAKRYSAEHPVDQFVFGHLHHAIQWPLAAQSKLTIVGEWIEGCEYAVFDGEKITLEKWQ